MRARLAATLLLAACSQPAPPAFANKVWKALTSSAVEPGTFYVFLSDGTLLITPAHGTSALGRGYCSQSSAERQGVSMPKGYWITLYRSVSNPAALTEYTRLAGPAIQAGGGRFIVRGTAARAFEAGLTQRAVVIEFDSVDSAVTTYESPAYQAALRVLEGVVERDVRIVEGAT